jgi:hypothetical protein
MSRRARKYAQARPWEAHTPNDDERAELDRLPGELPGDDQATDAHDAWAHEREREMRAGEMTR